MVVEIRHSPGLGPRVVPEGINHTVLNTYYIAIAPTTLYHVELINEKFDTESTRSTTQMYRTDLHNTITNLLF